MDAWIYVFDHSYFAVTDDSGTFTITDIHPGEYELIVEQPDTELRAKLTLNITGEGAYILD
jgi:hypothetical protein